MNKPKMFNNTVHLSLLILVASLALVGTASARVSGGLPPQFGKLCGSVNGATWKFQGRTGTRYNVTALSARSCAVALKAVGALTKQKPQTGALGPHTLVGPSGFLCKGSAIKSVNAGFCHGSKGAGFFWAPRLSK